jgi:pimeloyl-ACP methyl ester carboxylesterase
MPDLHTVRAGSGPVLLCLHGIGSSSQSFAAQIDGLSDIATVVAWDAPGYGSSPAWNAPRGMDGYADDAVTVLDDLGVQAADVLGTSFGGVVATRMALRHPRRVRSLVLADARAARLTSPGADQELVQRIAATMAHAISLPGYAHAAAAMAATDHRDALGAVTAPALVLVGEHDQVTPPALSRSLAAALPNATYEEVPAAGHVSNVENPTEFNRSVRVFLDTIHDRTLTTPGERTRHAL